MAAEAPEVFSGWSRSITANGTEIGDWVSDWHPESEDDDGDFQGSNGKPKATFKTGNTLKLSFTVANHPTPMGILEPAHYAVPQPVVTFVASEYSGRSITYTTTIRHLDYQGGAGDALTVDVDCRVTAVSGIPGV